VTTSTEVSNVLTEFDVADAPTLTTVSHSWSSESVRTSLPSVSHLKDFLSRPVLTHTFTWGTSVGGTGTHTPLSSYLNLASIADKIRYFQNMRFTLCVRLQTSTTTHHYGLAGVSMLPYTLSNAPTNYIRRSSTDYFTLFDANSCDSVVIKFPFFYYADAYQIAVNGSIPDDYAVLYWDTFQPIGRDDGVAPGTPNVTVYTWLEDVELMDPTPYQAASGKPAARKAGASLKKVQHEGAPPPSGVVSGPMSALSSMVAKASAFPGVGKYATASSIGMGAMAEIAALFGFSRPVASMDTSYMIQRPVGSLSAATGTDSVMKITLDPENQLAVGLGQLGAEDDPLAYSSLLRRWGYVGSFTWATTDTTDTAKAIITVSPVLAPVSGTTYMLPPCSLPILFYKAWSGTMEYKFVVSATPFHRGKLLMWYSPGQAYGNLAAATVLPIAQSCILDVANATEKHVIIGWSQNVPYLDVVNSENSYPTFVTNLTSGSGTGDNGAFHVQVLEPLQAPNAAATLTISVFQRGGDDLWYGIPYGTGMMQYNAASGAPAKRDPFRNLGVSGQTEAPCMFGGGTLKSHTYLNVVGESIPSLRPLLKRYTPTLVLEPSAYTQTVLEVTALSLYFPLYPMARDQSTATQFWASGSPNSGISDVPSNIMGFLQQAFAGVRGAVRHKVIDVGGVLASHGTFGAATSGTATGSPLTTPNKTMTFVNLAYQDDAGQSLTSLFTYGGNTSCFGTGNTNALRALPGDLLSGGDLQINDTGIVAMIEVPMMMQRFFATPRRGDDLTFGPIGFRVNTIRGGWTVNPHLIVLSAAGEDYNLVFWMGTPGVYTGHAYNSNTGWVAALG